MTPPVKRSPPIAVLLKLLQPFEAFVRVEALGGTLLILASLVALVWANSSASESYVALWERPFTLGPEGFALTKPILLWVNDLLMAVFFLLVGLEIKRELLVGELNTRQKAILPALAAVGGMVVPALFYVSVANEGPAARGWGVPMATDIAFAIGVMRLLGNRVPAGLIVFLTALAIIDDLGAIIVIAVFYTSELNVTALLWGAAFIGVLVAMNRLGVRRPALYVFAGLPLWFAILKSGIHATIAGVIVGFCVPAASRFDLKEVLADARALLGVASDKTQSPEVVEASLRALEKRFDDAESPLSNLEHALHPYVAYAIVPLFALANAGVVLIGASPALLLEPVSLGVILGLVLGKPIGVIGVSLLTVKLGWARLPAGVTMRHLVGAGMLAGIGFTMSLFVAGLGFEAGSIFHTQAKVGILAASILSGLGGLLVLRSAKPVAPA